MAYNKNNKPQLKESILDLLSKGKSLNSILTGDKEMPSRQIVYNWLNTNHIDFDKTFLDNYVRAREDSSDLDAETIQEIAEKTLSGVYDAQAARVAIDAYKWSAGKKNPKKYGDKVDLELKGKITLEQIKGMSIE